MDNKDLKTFLKGGKIIDVTFDWGGSLTSLTVDKDGKVFLVSVDANVSLDNTSVSWMTVIVDGVDIS